MALDPDGSKLKYFISVVADLGEATPEVASLHQACSSWGCLCSLKHSCCPVLCHWTKVFLLFRKYEYPGTLSAGLATELQLIFTTTKEQGGQNDWEQMCKRAQSGESCLQQCLLLLPDLAVGTTQLEESFPTSNMLHLGKLFQGTTILSALGAPSLSAANVDAIYPFHRGTLWHSAILLKWK